MQPSPAVQEALSRFTVPLRVWLAPAAAAAVGDALADVLGATAEVVRDPLEHVSTLEGPSVVTLLPADLNGPHRAQLLELIHRAAPGRPVLYGGTRSRDVLMEAINKWRVFRVVPDQTPPAVLADAILRAHEQLRTEMALGDASDQLRSETTKLHTAVTELQDSQARLLHTERLTTMGRITGGLIQSIRQHQNALDTFAAVARPLTTDPELLQLLEHAAEGTRSIATLLDEIQAYAQEREQSYEMVEEPLDELAARAVSFSRFDSLGRERSLETRIESGARVVANRHRIYQVLLNLIRNAFQATPPGGTVEVHTRTEGETAIIEVTDTGTGMSEQTKARIFDPFFSTKGDKGLGLGLRITRAAVERHGGTIEVESTLGEGSRFRVRLPCAV